MFKRGSQIPYISYVTLEYSYDLICTFEYFQEKGIFIDINSVSTSTYICHHMYIHMFKLVGDLPF